VAEDDRVTVFDWSEITWQGMDAGVAPDGSPWLRARPAIGGMGLGFYWGAPDGTLRSKLSIPLVHAIRVVGIDVDATAYICMDAYQSASSCVAFGPETDRARWRAVLPGRGAIAGAALAPGRLYVATWNGTLFAIGDGE
jgi:hypothetical protein